MNPWGEILVVDSPISAHDLRRLVQEGYGRMVKFVVDIERERVAIGGELHADAEAVLLQEGSRQQDLWGGNYIPGAGLDQCIEYTSFINIRPSLENFGPYIEIESVRNRVRELTHRLVGKGEEI